MDGWMDAAEGRASLPRTRGHTPQLTPRAAAAAPLLLLRRGLTPLMVAAAAGHKETVALLLQMGADWSATDKFGRSALVHASECIITSCPPTREGGG